MQTGYYSYFDTNYITKHLFNGTSETVGGGGGGEKLDRQNLLGRGQHSQHFRHSRHVNQISSTLDIFPHLWQKNSRGRRANDKCTWRGKHAQVCSERIKA